MARDEAEGAGDGGAARREAILAAALGLFLERGYAATSIADIRAASGASTGSIYHFFRGKGGVAHALLTEALDGGPAGAVEADVPAEMAIKGAVTGLVRWATANPGRFRFMDELGSLARVDPDLAEVGEALAAGQGTSGAAYRRHVAAGQVKALAWPIAHAVILGPAHAWLRLPAEAQKPGPRRAAELLADAAWDAVRVPGRRTAR
ncbi:MAG: TetR/AcrR family transcriptional regulator [Bauldia sp.]|nr:TetR/AcrR family transcriptional regulator [Bauldia sp.]